MCSYIVAYALYHYVAMKHLQTAKDVFQNMEVKQGNVFAGAM